MADREKLKAATNKVLDTLVDFEDFASGLQQIVSNMTAGANYVTAANAVAAEEQRKLTEEVREYKRSINSSSTQLSLLQDGNALALNALNEFRGGLAGVASAFAGAAVVWYTETEKRNVLLERLDAQRSMLEKQKEQTEKILEAEGFYKDAVTAMAQELTAASQAYATLNVSYQSAISELEKQGASDDEINAAKKEYAAQLEVARSKIEELTETYNDGVNATERISASQLLSASGTRKLNDNLERLNDSVRVKKSAVDDATEEIKKNKQEQSTVDVVSGFSRLQTVLLAVRDAFQLLIKAIRETQQALGVEAGVASVLLLQYAKESIDSYVKTFTSFGQEAPVSVEEIGRMVESFRGEFGGIIPIERAAELAKEAKEQGMTAKMVADMRRTLLTPSLGDIGKALSQQQLFLENFKRAGLTNKDLAEELVKNSELVARNGFRFSDAFSRALAESKKIGFEMSKISQFGDNIIGNFEGFLEGQAELGAMGFGFDTSRLAEIAETGSDADLFNELRSQLAMTGKDITNLRRSEQLALSSAFGMNMSDFQKLAGITPEGGGEGIEDLQKISNSTLAKILTQITNIANALLPVLTGAAAVYGIRRALSRFRAARATRTPPVPRSPTSRLGRLAERARTRSAAAVRGAQEAVRTRLAPMQRRVGRVLEPVARTLARPGVQRALRVAGRAAIVAGGGMSGYQGYQTAIAAGSTQNEALAQGAVRAGSSITGIMAGGKLGAMAGGALGTVIGGPAGTLIGGIVGGVGGAIVGERIMTNIADRGLDLFRRWRGQSQSVAENIEADASKMQEKWSSASQNITDATASAATNSTFNLQQIADAMRATVGKFIQQIKNFFGSISSILATIREKMPTWVGSTQGNAVTQEQNTQQVQSTVTASRPSQLIPPDSPMTSAAGRIMDNSPSGVFTKAALIAAVPTGGMSLVGLVIGRMLSNFIGKKLTADDMVSKPGYGQRTLVTPNNVVALNDQDNVVAYADDMVSQNAGLELLSKGAISREMDNTKVNVDMTALERKMDQMIAAITNMREISMDVKMDADLVGRAIVKSSERSMQSAVFRPMDV
jgi:hypothetical protein